jgi:hypothetical protein
MTRLILFRLAVGTGKRETAVENNVRVGSDYAVVRLDGL